MKTAREKADEWVCEHVVLSENCDIEYTDLIKKLELLLKEQDRDTRHACAEACAQLEGDWGNGFYHDTCMGVKAV